LLEAGFLGVMLFGWDRVRRKLHFFATVMVAIGTLISMFWILSSNSWMQTPQGIEIIDGRVVPLDWFKIVFNPSFPYRLAHMALAAFLSTAFFVSASAAWHLLRGRNTPQIRKMLSMGMWMILVATPVQIVVGDAHGLNTLEHQPAKIAAIEGHWENIPGEPSPLILAGWPDMEAEKTRFAIEIPYLGSLILTHSLDRQIPALKSFAKEDRPNSTVVFWSFRVMAGLGMLMLACALLALVLRRNGALYRNRLFLGFALLMGPSGLIALLAGWFTTEVGRQPWVVYGMLRTNEAASNHSAAQMSLTLGLFVLIYFSVFTVGICYMMSLVRKGPTAHEQMPSADQPESLATARRPLSVAD
ncbi:cytochrome ubiquinol oxidase subunit I, partial [Pseudomonas sp.]|uniref:cytochrome ubiquinol oxidase subunit I n=1 Tax=Pseudomonas sp. TaxID=306 RepID=UPI0028A91276